MKIQAAEFQLLLIKNSKFSEYVINNYPELEANVRSYRQDPNCSCRHKIAKYFEDNREAISQKILSWVKETGATIEGLTRNPEHLNVLKPTLSSLEQTQYKDVIGEIVEIPPDPTEYKRIISIARAEWLYNGINILETVKFDPQTKKESVVWLLLFY